MHRLLAAEIGDALAELFTSGAAKREDLWLTGTTAMIAIGGWTQPSVRLLGKLNNPYHRKEHVLPHLKKTLLDLRVEQLE